MIADTMATTNHDGWSLLEMYDTTKNIGKFTKRRQDFYLSCGKQSVLLHSMLIVENLFGVVGSLQFLKDPNR